MKSLSLSRPHLIMMVGIPGSGKTFFAEKFADTFHAPYVSYEKIATYAGSSEAYIEDLLVYQLNELFKTRQSILVEGVADTRVQRLELSKLAHSAGYETILVWVQTDLTTAKSRFKKEQKLRGVGSPEDFDEIVHHFIQPAPAEKPVVISGKHTYATQAKVILKKLSGPRAEVSNQVTPPSRSESPEPSVRRRNITVR